MKLASSTRINKHVNSLLAQDESLWLAKRGDTTILASAFAIVNVTDRTPRIMPKTDSIDATFSYGPRPTPIALWRLWDEWVQAEQGITLRSTNMYMRIGSSILALVMLPEMHGDNLNRYTLVDEMYLRLIADDVSDLHNCEIDMLLNFAVRIRREGELLAVIMPMSANAISKNAIQAGCSCCGAMLHASDPEPASESEEANA